MNNMNDQPHLKSRLAVMIVAVCLAATSSWGQDPTVALIAADVQRDNVETVIQTLQDFQTRYSYSPECDAAGDWLYSAMAGYGVDVSFESFEYDNHTMRNVVGRIEGVGSPDSVFIIGAHYDSTSTDPWNDAPGADDNASGVAAVLEAARIMSAYDFEYSIEFICFSGEEQGRRGSEANVANAVSEGKNILGMINLDMIGFWPESSDMEMDIGKNSASSWLADIAVNATLSYANLPVHNWPDTGVCYDDHVSYWAGGYSAITFMDCYEAHYDPGGSGETTPHYHKTTDTIATLDLDQTTEAVRAAVATMAILAVPALFADNFESGDTSKWSTRTP